MTKSIRKHFIYMSLKSSLENIYPGAFATLETYLDTNTDIYAYSVDEIPMGNSDCSIFRYTILCDDEQTGYIMEDLRDLGIK